MFVIGCPQDDYTCDELDEGAEEHIYYRGRLLRCPTCQQPVPVMAYYDGLFHIVDDETTEELQWTWQHDCLS